MQQHGGISDSTESKQNQRLDGLKILLVEGEQDIKDLVKFILEDAGAEVFTTTYAYQALQALDHYSPDILISDTQLSDQKGDWLIKRIRAKEKEQKRRMPTIAITSYTREFTANELLEAGFDLFLSQTISSELLISSVLTLVEQVVN